MNQLAQELRNEPELAEKLLSDAGKIGLAYLATQVRVLTLENEKLLTQIANAHSKADRLARELEQTNANCKKLQNTMLSRLEIIQNQIRGNQ